MNRDTLRDYFGRVDYTDEIECREIMMERIRYVRSELGSKTEILDEYLRRLFSALSEMPSVMAIGTEGFEQGSGAFWRAARQIRDGEYDEAKEYELYPIIREYISTLTKTPNDLVVPVTAIGLFSEYFERATRVYHETILDEHDRLMDKHDVASAREALCKERPESEVDEMERAIYTHRWLVSPVQIYGQGLIDDVAMTLCGQSGCSNETAVVYFIGMNDE